MDIYYHMIQPKSNLLEVEISDGICGLGVVDAYDVVHFKQLSRNDVETKTHQQVGLPGSRDRFRYFNGIVGWTDAPSSPDAKLAIEEFLAKHNYPFKKHIGYFGDDIDENYNKSLSDDEQHDLAVSYFDIGHDNNEDDFGSVTDEVNYCWIWDKGTQSINAKKGGTHSTNFGSNKIEHTFSGWFDGAKNKLSIVFPEYELRKLGNNKRPTEDDIPTQIYQALIRTFGKRKPQFVVFESKYDIDDEEVSSYEKPYGGWIDPDAGFHIVKFQQHDEYGKALLRKLNLYNPNLDIHGQMYPLGFIRVAFDGNTLYYRFKTWNQANSPTPTQRQIKELKDLAIEYNCSRIVDCETSKEMTDFIPPTRPDSVDESFKETNYDDVGFKSWWVDPNGKIYDIDDGTGRTHWTWAERYLKKLYGDKPYGNESPTYILFNLGWVRLAFNYFKDGALHFDTTKSEKITNTMMRHIKNHAIEIHASALVDDNTRKSVDLLQEAVTAEKEKEVKGYLSRMNDDTIVVSVNRFDEMPAASYVQVDGFWNKENVFSSNPEDLAKWGFLMPSTKQLLTLPTGQYKLGDAKKRLRQSLNEMFKPDGELRWWLDTSGKLHDVQKEGHSVWGMKYIVGKYGKDSNVGKYASESFQAPYTVLFGAGWVRLVMVSSHRMLAYEYDKPPTRKLMSIIKQLGKKLNVRTLYNEITHKTESISENISEDMSYEELLKLTTPERKERASNVTARSLPVTVENGLDTSNFRYKSSPATTVTDKPFRGSISFIKERTGNNQNAMKMKCKVDCECPDFMYRFAYNDAAKGASQIGTDSLNGALNRRPKPAYDYGEGLCKHLAALGRFLKTKITATKKSNLFEAIDEVANQGPFNVTYYD